MKNKNVSKEAVPFGKRVLGFVQNNSVPLMFVLICIICIPISGFSVGYLVNEIVTRMGRNIFLIGLRYKLGGLRAARPTDYNREYNRNLKWWNARPS